MRYAIRSSSARIGSSIATSRSWDEVTVFAAVHAIGPYFNTDRGTFRMVGDKGDDEWIPDEKSASCRLLPAEGRERRNYPGWKIGRLIDELIAREPKSRRAK